MNYVTKQSTAPEKDTPYFLALLDYFDTLDELDKIHGLQYKTNQRHKLKVKLKALSNKCKDIEGQLSRENEKYVRFGETIKTK